MEIFFLLIGLACIWAGDVIGKKKGRRLAGRLLGFFLGPIGVAIIYFLKPKDVAAATPENPDW